MSKQTSVTDLSVVENNTLAIPDSLESYFEEHAGEGKEDYGSGDFALPYLVILQKGSPQVDETNGKYINGAKQGMVFNTVTGEFFDTLAMKGRDNPKGLLVVTVANQRRFVEWVPRDEGGGFAGQHLETADIVKQAKPHDKRPMILVAPNGNHLIETTYRYVVVAGETPQWGVIAFSSTQLKKARTWATMLATRVHKLKSGKSINPPHYGQLYRLTTIPEQNDFGSWFGWHIEPAGLVGDEELLQAAKAYRDSVTAGSVKAAAPLSESDITPEPAAKTAGSDDNIPF